MSAKPLSNPAADEQRQLQRACQDLVVEFDGKLSREQVQQRFEGIVHSFEGAPVRNFVPVLVNRVAREDLRRLASA